MKKTYTLSYLDAVNYEGGTRILCNNISEIEDYRMFEDMDLYNEEEDRYEEVFQWYLTSWSYDDVEELKTHFPSLHIGYSEKLDLFVLAVTHYGTSWDYVPIEMEVDSERDYLCEWAKSKEELFNKRRG